MPNLLSSIRAAASRLSPHEVAEKANRPIAVALVAGNSAGYADMEDFLVPADVEPERRRDVLKIVHRDGDSGNPDRFDLVLYEQGMACPINAYTFFPDDPDRTLRHIRK